MKQSKFRKAIALILSVSMMSSVLALGSFSAGAVEEVTTVKNDYVPSEDTDTYRAYFYMPENWYNEYTDTAGAYWWEGTDACPTWQDMYSMNSTDAENIYYMDIPVDVNKIILNNYIDRGEDPDAPVYNKAAQTIDILFAPEEYDGESWVYFPEVDGCDADCELYKEGLKTVDCMIFVLDSGRTELSPVSQSKICDGEWYYYYGNGEYGSTPEKGNIVYTGEYQSVEDAIADKYSSDKPAETESTELSTDPEETESTEFSTDPEDTESTEISTEPEETESTEFSTEPEETDTTPTEGDINNGGSGEISDPFEETTEDILPSTYESAPLPTDDTDCTMYIPESTVSDEEYPTYEIPREPIPSTPIVEPTEPDESETAVENGKIYFDIESSGWKNYEKVYCHIWRADGTGIWPSWQTKKELCDKEDDGTYSYTLSKTENEFRYTDGNVYCVIFSTDTGAQTYNIVMNGLCIGDTVYVTGNTFENPEDSDKTCVETAWRKNPDCGSERKITSTGNIVGTAYVDGATDETLLASFLVQYCYDYWKMEQVDSLIEKLNVTAEDVLYQVAVKENTDLYYGYKTLEEAEAEYAIIKEVLGLKEEETLPPVVDEDTATNTGSASSGNDISGDGVTDVKDVTALQMHLASYVVDVDESVLDVNKDDKVDVSDVTTLQMILAGYELNL